MDRRDIVQGSGPVDADVLRDGHRAPAGDDVTALTAVNRRGLAYRASAEFAWKSAAQGVA